MKKIIAISAVVALSIVYTSCKKENKVLPDKNCEITVANIIGSYKVIEAKYKANSTAAEIDYLDELFDNAECAKDDSHTFGENGILTITDAGTRCTPPTEESETWSLSGNKITVDDEVSTVEGIDCQAKIMMLKYSDWDEDGDELRVLLRKQ